MFTSRAEFRLHLRIDNADTRLTPHGRALGLIDDTAWADFEARQRRLAAMTHLLETTRADTAIATALEAQHRIAMPAPADEPGASSQDAERNQTAEALSPPAPSLEPPSLGRSGDRAPGKPQAAHTGNVQDSEPWLTEAVKGQLLSDLLKRPDLRIDDLAPLLRDRLATHDDLRMYAADPLPATLRNELRAVETELKYAGYLDQQRRQIEKLRRAEQRNIPLTFRYTGLSGLSRELQEKLERIRPSTIGQASRIPGVTPAAMTLLNVLVEVHTRQAAAVASAPATTA